MSWKDWVDGYIINHTEASGECVYAICRRGAIVGEDGAIWGEVNFEFLEYEMEQENDNGGMDKFVVNEWANLKHAWDNQGKSSLRGGIRMNNEKFLLASFDEDRNVMYLGGDKKGACVAKAETCFCIGVYYKIEEPLQTSFEKTRQFSAGNANGAVENCRDKCVESGI